MLATASDQYSSELRLPSPERARAATIAYLLVLFLFIVALYNVLFLETVRLVVFIASITWIALVSMVVAFSVWDEGVRNYMIKRLGYYSRNHFIRAHHPLGEVGRVYIGFSLFGRSFSYLQLDTDAIAAISWRRGQASSMSGRDMNDWYVVLSYGHPDGDQHRSFAGPSKEERFLIEPAGPRRIIETRAAQIAAFLREAGAELRPIKQEADFVTQPQPR